MAVDIKTLRVGSHVEHKGKRVCVDEIRTLRLDDEPMSLLVSYNGLVYGNPSIDEVEPIPITPSLLKELGFEDCAKKRWHTEDWEKRWGECQYLSFTKLYRGEWRVHYFDGAKDRGQTVVRYLHEAELFLGLHNIELIEEE